MAIEKPWGDVPTEGYAEVGFRCAETRRAALMKLV
jgi:hypothetical protein